MLILFYIIAGWYLLGITGMIVLKKCHPDLRNEKMSIRTYGNLISAFGVASCGLFLWIVSFMLLCEWIGKHTSSCIDKISTHNIWDKPVFWRRTK
jgi:hypothetical protein